MKEQNKAKGKAAVKQDLEDTLSFYSESLTRKVVGQLFDEYVKDDEYSYYADTSSRYDENDYNTDDIEILSDSDNSERSFYFGNTFSEFSKDELISNYESEYKFGDYDENDVPANNYNKSFTDSDDYKNNKSTASESDAFPAPAKKKKSKDLYEYDDFDDDFDEYDYEPKKKIKKQKKQKETFENEDYEEYEDVFDRKKREREVSKKKNKESAPKKFFKSKSRKTSGKREQSKPSIIITDLTASKKKSKDDDYSKNLPPLERRDISHRELGYEDVMRYSPRRRGGRNPAVKKKKRIPLSENRNIYPSSSNTAEQKTVRTSNPRRKRRIKLRLFFIFSFFALIISLVFCIIKISNLTKEIDDLKAIIQSHSEYDTGTPSENESILSSPDSSPI